MQVSEWMNNEFGNKRHRKWNQCCASKYRTFFRCHCRFVMWRLDEHNYRVGSPEQLVRSSSSSYLNKQNQPQTELLSKLSVGHINLWLSAQIEEGKRKELGWKFIELTSHWFRLLFFSDSLLIVQLLILHTINEWKRIFSTKRGLSSKYLC